MTTSIIRTIAIRLRADLLELLKKKAQSENRLLNDYIESILLNAVNDGSINANEEDSPKSINANEEDSPKKDTKKARTIKKIWLEVCVEEYESTGNRCLFKDSNLYIINGGDFVGALLILLPHMPGFASLQHDSCRWEHLWGYMYYRLFPLLKKNPSFSFDLRDIETAPKFARWITDELKLYIPIDENKVESIRKQMKNVSIGKPFALESIPNGVIARFDSVFMRMGVLERTDLTSDEIIRVQNWESTQ